jgi:hypothetical protein
MRCIWRSRVSAELLDGINFPRDTCQSASDGTLRSDGVQPSWKSSMWTSKGSADMGATLSPVCAGVTAMTSMSSPVPKR